MGRPRREPLQIEDTPPAGKPMDVLPPEQPFLFENWPEQPVLVERVKEFIHTGKHAIGNLERCDDVISAVLNGASDRAVAAHFHIGRQTIRAIYKLFEENGLLLPLKQRLAKDWVQTTQLAQWRMQQALVNGEMPLQVLPALAGIGTDKVEALTHSMPEEGAQKTIDVTPQSILERVRRAKAADAASDGQTRKPLVGNVGGVPDTAADTVRPGGMGRMDGPGTSEGLDRGGGDRGAKPGANGGGDGSGNSVPKDAS